MSLSKHILALLFTCLLGCTPSLPGGIMDEEEMADVLVDFHLAQGMAEAHGEDIEATRYEYIQTVFRKHHITEAEFDSSMTYYSGRAEHLAAIYDNVVTRVRAQAERMGLQATTHDQFASITAEGDTADIWLGKDFACIVPNWVGCVYTFQMKADSTFRQGDSYIWRFKTQYIGRSMNNEAIALLNLHYDTDTVASISEQLRDNPMNELRHTPDAALDTLNLRTITGIIYLPVTKGGDPSRPLLVSQMQLIRMHRQSAGQDTTTVGEPVELQPDTLAADTLTFDTMPQHGGTRLTPLQVRENRQKVRRIKITKKR